jgi:hypothetical protein
VVLEGTATPKLQALDRQDQRPTTNDKMSHPMVHRQPWSFVFRPGPIATSPRRSEARRLAAPGDVVLLAGVRRLACSTTSSTVARFQRIVNQL